ncbi:MAG: fused MFS/spermidine synthase [Verrucomicrobiota bacterium]
MRLLALTIFLGAFLIFQVEPLIANYILPWFGGSSEVWTACMLFFQSALFTGYAYAHFIAGHFKLKNQVIIHSAVLLFSVLWLPITPPEALRPDTVAAPVLLVLLVLTVSVGWPFFVISSTTPLLQSWLTKAYPKHSPYRLYALSNAGSLLSLIAYPFVVEPWLSLPDQTQVWSIAYLGFVIFSIFTGAKVWRNAQNTIPSSVTAMGSPKSRQVATPIDSSESIKFNIILWLAMSACGSVMLLAVTNQLCQIVASVPFLWVLPLGIYLLSFIFAFAADSWYRREVFGLLWIVALGFGFWLDLGAFTIEGVKPQIAVYCFILFVCCMVCHGELAHLRPNAKKLTLYYLVISLGGFLGGVSVALVAPAIFTFFYEFYFGLIGSGVILLVMLRRDHWKKLSKPKLRISVLKTCLLILVMILLVGGASAVKERNSFQTKETIAVHRDFYGIVKVQREQGYKKNDTVISFVNGNTVHGFQFESESKRTIPVCYYERSSGIGLAVDFHSKRIKNEPLKVGLIGLGVGTLAAYANKGDEFLFYEINPSVEVIARQYFTYLNDAEARGAQIEIKLGDARLSLERSLKVDKPIKFDLLVLDAFNSDSVPVHLLTLEAFDLYRKHLQKNGIIAIHVSNRYLDLTSVVRSSLSKSPLEVIQIVSSSTNLALLPENTTIDSDWILATGDPEFLKRPEIKNATSSWPKNAKMIRWTDHFSSLFHVLK